MKTNQSNVAPFPTQKAVRDTCAYRNLVADITKSPDKPLRLVINCRRVANVLGASSPQVELLAHEIELWAELLSERKITSFFLFHPFEHLAPFEVTRLLHIIASQFKIPEHTQKDFIIISEVSPISLDQLALSKGLGFVNFQIVVDHTSMDDSDFQTVEKKVSMLRDYDFSSVGLQLSKADCLDEIRGAIQQLSRTCNPDYICIGSNLNELDIVVDNGTEFIDHLDASVHDTIALGPEGINRIGGQIFENYCAAKTYREFLESKRLPIRL